MSSDRHGTSRRRRPAGGISTGFAAAALSGSALAQSEPTNFCKKLVNDAAQALGGLDILVSNAARQHAYASFTEISTEEFDWTFKTNVYAMFWLTKAAMAHLKPGSAIIETASINAYDPSEDIIDYAATKGAIMIRTKALAKQLVKKGIRVNAVAPGPVWTPLQPSSGQLSDKLPQFGANPLSGGRRSLWNWRRSMCCSLPANQASPPVRSMGQPAAAAGRKAKEFPLFYRAVQSNITIGPPDPFF